MTNLDQNIRALLIKRGVKNLREFGYPSCNAENILTDMIYSKFFLSILQDNLGHAYDSQINALMAEIQKHHENFD